MRLLGDYLHSQGHTVLGIRLAGHATRIEDMRHANWQDWLASVEDGIDMLKSCCSKVISVGLSMGGTLSMLAAANYPLAAAVAISAPTNWMKTPAAVAPSQFGDALYVKRQK
jgi:carboxylesterase